MDINQSSSQNPVAVSYFQRCRDRLNNSTRAAAKGLRDGAKGLRHRAEGLRGGAEHTTTGRARAAAAGAAKLLARPLEALARPLEVLAHPIYFGPCADKYVYDPQLAFYWTASGNPPLRKPNEWPERVYSFDWLDLVTWENHTGLDLTPKWMRSNHKEEDDQPR